MWLTRRMKEENNTAVKRGEVSAEETFTVTEESVHRQPQMLLPYGYYALPPGGENAVMVGDFCAGVAAVQDTALQVGEVRICSAGGAEILLKNDGTVVINGQVWKKG